MGVWLHKGREQDVVVAASDTNFNTIILSIILHCTTTAGHYVHIRMCVHTRCTLTKVEFHFVVPPNQLVAMVMR